jgi:hypothetical protein
MGEHWLGVIVVATVAAASGWTLARQHNPGVAHVEDRTSSDLGGSPDPPGLMAQSPDQSSVVSDRTQVESSATAHESDGALARINAEDLATTLTLGTDSERHAALTKALQYDIELPPDLLVNAYVNDPSDDVRLLAFTTYIDSQSDVEVIRSALRSAMNNTSQIVQAEAQRQFDELTSYEAAVAATALQELP